MATQAVPSTILTVNQAATPFTPVTGSGGTSPLTYGVAPALPAGLTLAAASGQITGTPTVASPATVYAATVTDANANTASATFSLTVAPATLTTTQAVASTTLTAGAPATPFTPVTASGGFGAVTFAVSPALPTALVFSTASGQISGTPSAALARTIFTVTATDQTTPAAQTSSKTFSLTVKGSLVVAAATPSKTISGAGPVSFRPLQVTGGAGPLRFAIAPVLPAGLTLSATTGLITGTPTANSPLTTYVVTVTDANGVTASASFRLAVALTTAVADSATTLQHTPVTIAVTANDTGGPFSAIAIVRRPAHGQVSVAGLSAVYSPDSDFTGVDIFTYRATAAGVTSAPATVQITVSARPDPSKDADVIALISQQNQAAQRFAETQIDNVQSRMESLHGDGYGRDSFGVTLQPNPASEPVPEAFDPAAYAPQEPVAAPTSANGRTARLAAGGRSGRGRLTGAAASADKSTTVSGYAGDLSPDTRIDRAFSFWSSGSIIVGTDRGPTPAYEGRFRTSGLSAGVDYRLNQHVTVGVALGYGHEKARIGQSGSTDTAESYNITGYASVRPTDDLFLDSVIGVGLLNFDSYRAISGSQNFADGERDGRQFFGSVTFGYEYRDESWLLSPYGRLGGQVGQLDAFTESGGGLAALHYDNQDISTLTATLGARARFSYDTSFGSVSPFARAELHHDLQGGKKAGLSYADLQNGPQYSLDIEGYDRTDLTLGLGFEMSIYDFDTMLEYDTGYGDEGGKAQSVRFRFGKSF